MRANIAKVLIAGLLALLVVVVLLIVACPKPAPAPPAPPPVPKAAAKLIVATDYLAAEVLDPSFGPITGCKWLPLYDTLVGAALDGRLSNKYGLARDWQVKNFDTHSTYTFYLRQGVKFHDGTEVTAEDVKFSLEYFARKESVSTNSALWRKVIDRIEVPERYTVVLHTKGRRPLLLLLLSRGMPCGEGFILPKNYIEKHGAAYFNKNPIGTGPYKLKEQVVGSHLTFEAIDYEHFAYGVPRYKEVTVKLVPEETTRTAMLKRGEADVIVVTRERSKELKAAGFNIFIKKGGTVVPLALGNTWEKGTYLNDPRVREALNLAIDRKALLEHVFAGLGEISSAGYYGTWSYNYRPFPLYDYDADRAKKLLIEAFPKGIEITIHSFSRPGAPEQSLMNEAIAGMWKKAFGDLIKVKLVPMDYAAHRPFMAEGRCQNIAFGYAAANRPDWSSIWDFFFHSKGLLTVTKDPKLDAMIDALAAAADWDELGELQYKAAKYIRDNHYIVPLVEIGDTYATTSKITEWTVGGVLPYDSIWDLIVHWK